MLRAAGKIARAENAVLQETGRVVLADDRVFAVRTPSGSRQARRAVSCLVEPEVDDRVLVAVEGGSAWVLAVLERRAGAPLSLGAEGDVTFRLQNGAFAVAAQEGISLATAGDATVVAAGLHVDAAEGSMRVERMSYLGQFLRGEVERIQLVAGALDAFLERLVQKVKRSFRTVTEIDQLRAGQIDYTAEQNARIHAENAVVTAQKLVKIDGQQIHVG